jgi:hypothetical protein
VLKLQVRVVFLSLRNLKEFLDIQQYFVECSRTVNGIITPANGSSAIITPGKICQIRDARR